MGNDAILMIKGVSQWKADHSDAFNPTKKQCCLQHCLH